MPSGFSFNLSPQRVNVPEQNFSFMDDITGRYQQRKVDNAAGAAVDQYAQGALTPEQAAEVAPLLKNPQTRAAGLAQIQAWKKPKEFDVQIAPDGTPLRIDQQAGTIEKLAGNYARPREPSQADRNTPEARAAVAVQNGLQVGTPEYQRYVLTGTLPAGDRGVTAGDREAIRDADDIVQQGEGARGLLNQALTLSDTAYTGPTAPLRAKVMGLIGDEGANDTQNLDNILTENSLSSMKAIFGGNPTEGERAILLEIQGASSKPKAVRDEIIGRAIKAVDRRVQYNKDRAGELRGGTYYKPETATTPVVPGAEPAPAAAPGAPKPGTQMDGYIFRGGDPKDPKSWAKMP